MCLQELEKFKFVLDYKIKELKRQIEDRLAVLVRMRTAALKAGTDPEVRAKVAGRAWQTGDGY